MLNIRLPQKITSNGAFGGIFFPHLTRRMVSHGKNLDFLRGKKENLSLFHFDCICIAVSLSARVDSIDLLGLGFKSFAVDLNAYTTYQPTYVPIRPIDWL